MRACLIALVLLLLLLCGVAAAQEIVLKGRIVDPQGNALPNATVELIRGNQNLETARTDKDGQFLLRLSTAGEFSIQVEAAGFRAVITPLVVRPDSNPEITISLSQLASRTENITVTADVNETDLFSPDPGEKVFVDQDLLDANPGRPGAPVSMASGCFMRAGIRSRCLELDTTASPTCRGWCRFSPPMRRMPISPITETRLIRDKRIRRTPRWSL